MPNTNHLPEWVLEYFWKNDIEGFNKAKAAFEKSRKTTQDKTLLLTPVELDEVVIEPTKDTWTSEDLNNPVYKATPKIIHYNDYQGRQSMRAALNDPLLNIAGLAVGLPLIAANPVTGALMLSSFQPAIRGLDWAMTPSKVLHTIAKIPGLSQVSKAIPSALRHGIGQILDGAVIADIIGESAKGLYNQGLNGTLLADKFGTALNALGVLPVLAPVTKTIKPIHSFFKNLGLFRNKDFLMAQAEKVAPLAKNPNKFIEEVNNAKISTLKDNFGYLNNENTFRISNKLYRLLHPTEANWSIRHELGHKLYEMDWKRGLFKNPLYTYDNAWGPISFTNSPYKSYINDTELYADRIASLTGDIPKKFVKNDDLFKLRVWNALNSKYYENPADFVNPHIIQYAPIHRTSKLSLAWFERPSKLSEGELQGLPKGARNLSKKPSIPISTIFESPDIPTKILIKDIPKATPRDVLSAYGYENPNFDLFIKNLDSLTDYIEEFKTPAYLTAARNYYNNFGFLGDRLTDDQIAKLLTLSYKNLTKDQSGILKGKVLWHGSSSGLFDQLDGTMSGKHTGNNGLYGTGFYLTNFPSSYGSVSYWDRLFGRQYYNNSLPYLVSGINEIGGIPTSYENSYGLAWHQPKGNITIPYSRSYNNYFYDGDNPFGLSKGMHFTRTTKQGKTIEAPKLFKGYNVQKTGIDDNGNIVVIDPGTGYKVALGNDSWMSQAPGRAFQSAQTIEVTPGMSGLLITDFTQNGVTYPATEIVVPYNSQVKSLFIHPDAISNLNLLTRSWGDKRLNFKQGGTLNYINLF